MTVNAADRLALALERLNANLEQMLGHGVPPAAPLGDALAYRWHHSRGFLDASGLVPVSSPCLVTFDSLQNIERHVVRLRNNTAQFVQGYPANNVLMTGARGTGKSSLVRACLEAFHEQGLRLIEVERQHLDDLPEIVAQVRDRAEKFIIFCDDLSFEEGELGYKGLKTVLDGSIAGPSTNVRVYATSNRRHMLVERREDNLERIRDAEGDLHPGDTVEEKTSLSERFGLHLHFYGFTQDEYLNAVTHGLATLGIDLTSDASIRVAALQWALERGARSGRVAWQFAQDYAGRRMIGADLA